MEFRAQIQNCPSLFFQLKDPTETDFILAIESFVQYVMKASAARPIRWEDKWTGNTDQQYLLESPVRFLSKILEWIKVSDKSLQLERIFDSCILDDFWNIPLRNILQVSRYEQDTLVIFEFIKFLFNRFGSTIPKLDRKSQIIYINFLAPVIEQLIKDDSKKIVAFCEQNVENFSDQNKILMYKYLDRVYDIKVFELYKDILNNDWGDKDCIKVKQDICKRLSKFVDRFVKYLFKLNRRASFQESQVIQDIVQILIFKLNDPSFDTNRVCDICNVLHPREGDKLYSMFVAVNLK